MSVTCGFYNSLNGDRKYDANQMSEMFDGLIIDGVFASIGTAFVVKASEGNTVNVGIGKAWFDHTWTKNDSVLPLDAPVSEVLLDRIDAVVLEVDSSDFVRNNGIKFIMGAPSSQPVRPTLTKNTALKQRPLAYIHRRAGSEEIRQADITNMVGSDETPFVTGILQTFSIEELFGRWEDELDEFVAREESDFSDWMNTEKAIYYEWFAALKADLLQEQELLNQWVASEQEDFLAWYARMKAQLGDDAAGSLQLQIDKSEIERILLVGFTDGRKAFSDDGTVITSTATDGRTLVKTFTEGFLTMTNVLKSATGTEIARMTKSFDSSGKLIDTAVIYI